MPLVRVDVHSHAVEELLKGGEVRRLLEEMGRSIADGAGLGHEVITEVGPSRVRVEVRTDTFEAMREEAHNRTLTRAIDRGRR